MRESKIMLIDNLEETLKKYKMELDKEWWNYIYADIDESVENNNYLIIDRKTKRIYEVDKKFMLKLETRMYLEEDFKND